MVTIWLHGEQATRTAAKWDRNGVQQIITFPKKSLGTKSTEMTEMKTEISFPTKLNNSVMPHTFISEHNGFNKTALCSVAKVILDML
jgi:hypothetical protein